MNTEIIKAMNKKAEQNGTQRTNASISLIMATDGQ